jgi:hypothetical protein
LVAYIIGDCWLSKEACNIINRCWAVPALSESLKVERSTQNPRGKTNIEQRAEPVRVSNPKQTPLGNLENGRQTGTTPEASDPSFLNIL